MSISGELFIGSGRRATRRTFHAHDPASARPLAPEFSAAGAAEIDAACALAWSAFDAYRGLPTERRAVFLEAIAQHILAQGEALLRRAHEETALPPARLEGERTRTVSQLRLFAAELRTGEWLGLRWDPALPQRQPAPRPDLRQRKIPCGPVAVFGASNFPLAFSVAGGDSAAALAAGCPIVVKGHPAHPGTSEWVARAIVAAAAATGMPNGVFSLLNGPDTALGTALVTDARIRAVAFTGSRGGGLALMKAAAARPEPIPVYAEMSSVNPVILLPAALAGRAATLAREFVASLTLGVGQFCTNPGLVLALEGAGLQEFLDAASGAVNATAPAVMLTPGIHRNYEQSFDRMAGEQAVSQLARGADSGGPHCGRAALFSVSARSLLADSRLAEEMFGPASLVVRCADRGELLAVLEHLEGQLTMTLQMDEPDHSIAQALLPTLERKAGRLIVNGWPTGVEVCHAMVHGGPFPATSDGRSTSVGTLAIERFLRPVCYQGFPESLLPEPLGDAQIRQWPHRLDGNHRAGVPDSVSPKR
ncbi:MAG TPA: aldehyde dehydrogenase (NADP(+)) [Steroidobacteraceae bacterium]|nr:aldehyde dehydrogenase (NADP(+)) [Steroidobacteraceae bacterium]